MRAANFAAFDIFGTSAPTATGNAPVNAKGNAMSETYELKAEAREQVGKGSAREVRRNGKVPAVIYGDKQPPLAIALSYKDIYYKIHGGGFLTTIATIDVGGKKVQVLPKDYQLDPVKDFPMHVDFLRIGKDTEVNVNVPVHFINEEKSPGIKRGGVLNIVRHEVEFHCPANAIPEFITIDLTGTDIGDSIHISAVKLPEGVKPVISDRDFTIATIAGSSAMKPEAVETEEVVEEAEEEEEKTEE
jgi:large subunit ribosomal protein L25